MGGKPDTVQRVTFANGAFEQSNFHDYTPIRLADAPQIDVESIQLGHHPSGIGEPAATVVAPAVANAVYNAVGARDAAHADYGRGRADRHEEASLKRLGRDRQRAGFAPIAGGDETAPGARAEPVKARGPSQSSEARRYAI